MAERLEGAGDPQRVLAMFALYRSTGAREWVEATGSSMHPLIRHGDRLLVEFGTTEPRFGEIVVFPDGGRVVAHRLVRRRRRDEGAILVTRGDATLHFDRPIPAAQTFGIVRACRRLEDGAAVSVAGDGLRAALVAGVSATSGYLLLAADRLPAGLGRQTGRAVRRIAPALVDRSARLAARFDSPSNGQDQPVGSPGCKGKSRP